MNKRRRATILVAMVATASLALVGCTSNQDKKEGKSEAAPPQLAVSPAANAKDLPISTEVGLTVTGGKVTEVTLTDDKGGKVTGSLRPDGSSWLPDKALKNKQRYTAQVTATNDVGKKVTQTTNFTTMDKPAKEIFSTLYFQDKRTYGVAMPVTVDFDPGVPKEQRADVQRRLFVTTTPAQPGAWHWTEDGQQVYYRAPDFWKPGTTISVKAMLGGVPMGKEGFGDADRTATAKIGEKVTLDIDNGKKQMSVFKDDKLVRKIPVSLGKPSTPTSSGKMVIMEKHEQTVFDTTGSADPYVVTVQDAQRLTWGGEFIHSAPWSEYAQGSTNTSHGCTNVSPADAAFLMKTTQVGDLVTVRGTEVQLEDGNGWTAWNMDWNEYVKGSALPVPQDLKPAAAPPAAAGAPAPSGSPSANQPPAPAPSNPGG
ncbi:Ig-like domain-containing protein [Micromonospora sp. NBC_01699]|uniref:L,D-transpeptidase n=1 Tax=Micromonospora sp. NBC_01699 TaxID=2975984 RepID=UPI002E3780D0|nr:Ig-like domain-containing protein [Micromonospora sp. NBC_01699]